MPTSTLGVRILWHLKRQRDSWGRKRSSPCSLWSSKLWTRLHRRARLQCSHWPWGWEPSENLSAVGHCENRIPPLLRERVSESEREGGKMKCVLMLLEFCMSKFFWKGLFVNVKHWLLCLSVFGSLYFSTFECSGTNCLWQLAILCTLHNYRRNTGPCFCGAAQNNMHLLWVRPGTNTLTT